MHSLLLGYIHATHVAVCVPMTYSLGRLAMTRTTTPLCNAKCIFLPPDGIRFGATQPAHTTLVRRQSPANQPKQSPIRYEHGPSDNRYLKWIIFDALILYTCNCTLSASCAHHIYLTWRTMGVVDLVICVANALHIAQRCMQRIYLCYPLIAFVEPLASWPMYFTRCRG